MRVVVDPVAGMDTVARSVEVAVVMIGSVFMKMEVQLTVDQLMLE